MLQSTSYTLYILVCSIKKLQVNWPHINFVMNKIRGIRFCVKRMDSVFVHFLCVLIHNSLAPVSKSNNCTYKLRRMREQIALHSLSGMSRVGISLRS